MRKEGFELTNGTALIATIPKVDDEYDLKTLTELAVSLKRDYPKTDSASVLIEPDVEYDHLIQAMDAIRSAEVPAAATDSNLSAQNEGVPQTEVQNRDAPEPTRVALFTKIAVGDAP